MVEDAAALTGDPVPDVSRRAVLVLCADNGVVAQGVSQTDASVTRAVLENLTARRTSVCRMAAAAHCDVVPVDMGIAGAPVPGAADCRIAAGTADFTTGPAMTLSLIHILEVEIVPGLTAALSGAAVLGAPLAHDFCVISLSDRLTPWAVIEKRLACAAAGDFCLALYNPSSIRCV